MPSNDLKIDDNNVLLEVDERRNSAAAATELGGAPSTAETLDRVGSAASEYTADAGAMNNNLNAARGELDDIEADDASPLKWIVPLALLVLLVALGSLFCSKP